MRLSLSQYLGANLGILVLCLLSILLSALRPDLPSNTSDPCPNSNKLTFGMTRVDNDLDISTIPKQRRRIYLDEDCETSIRRDARRLAARRRLENDPEHRKRKIATSARYNELRKARRLNRPISRRDYILAQPLIENSCLKCPKIINAGEKYCEHHRRTHCMATSSSTKKRCRNMASHYGLYCGHHRPDVKQCEFETDPICKTPAMKTANVCRQHRADLCHYKISICGLPCNTPKKAGNNYCEHHLYDLMRKEVSWIFSKTTQGVMGVGFLKLCYDTY